MASLMFKPLAAYYFRDGHLCRAYTVGQYVCTVSVPWSVSGELSPFDINISWYKRQPNITERLDCAIYMVREKLLVEARRLQRAAKRLLS